ncbi:hypothetical protein ANN_04423 [Periplaneta americana]|uniref:Uncharacterized protein n=1 Tax=Periplaneta americana TaxID=6978 RepID=A0ABQ8TAX1_PERAM|nr:hypothetical protein ANN_04423 [Periplaneta americana]
MDLREVGYDDKTGLTFQDRDRFILCLFYQQVSLLKLTGRTLLQNIEHGSNGFLIACAEFEAWKTTQEKDDMASFVKRSSKGNKLLCLPQIRSKQRQRQRSTKDLMERIAED